MLTFRQFLWGAVSATAVILSSPAFAQDKVASDDASSDEGSEIVVVAQKRAENIQDVPISIAAFGGETLNRANVLSVADLSRLATNFSATRVAQAANVRVTVRGIGAPGNTATEPSVASFLDGVYVPRPGSIIGGFLDIESVEVLRGPQGTLFGRNASVGALSLRSATPKQDFSAAVRGEVANADRYMLSGHVNLPISDNLAVRVAAQRKWFNGYWHNRLDDRTFGGADEAAARVSLKADLGPVTWVVRADYSKIEGDGLPNIDFDPATVSATQLAALRARLGGALPDTSLNDRQANQVLIGSLGDRHWGVSSDLSTELGAYTLRLVNSYRDWENAQTDGDVT